MGKKSGGCLCGAVRFSATPKVAEVIACHCSMCRRETAGPYLAILCDNDVTFDSEDDLGVYRSSDWAERGFCKKCGASLFWRMRDKSMTMISASAFDDPGRLRFTEEVFIDEKPSYYDFAGERTRMTGAEVIAMFKGEQPSA